MSKLKIITKNLGREKFYLSSKFVLCNSGQIFSLFMKSVSKTFTTGTEIKRKKIKLEFAYMYMMSAHAISQDATVLYDKKRQPVKIIIARPQTR